jgi:lipoprotein-releasing system ATP-binding protein
MNDTVIQCRGVRKVFRDGRLSVDVLQGINFSVKAGEQVAIVGTSGSGKSTLLHILGGLSEPSEGQVHVCGQDINQLSQVKRGNLRNQALGFVYQFHHLLPEFSALENVAMPLLIRREASSKALSQAKKVLERVGLGDRLEHKPGELSGGERQRAAIARAVVTRPKCILADEPTGNLDSQAAGLVHQLLLELNDEFDTALVVVTHDLSLAKTMHRIVNMEGGLLLTQG